MKLNNASPSHSKKIYLIFVLELIAIIAMIGILYLILHLTKNEPKVTVLDPEKLSIPTEITQQKEEGTSTMKGYFNIALFGVDAENDKQLFKGSHSDSTMIASINLDTGDIRLCSVYRDTYLNIGNEYRKCNAAYFYGGAEQAIRMLNSNLDMDIEHFAVVGYKGISEIIDSLGGIYIDVDSAEIDHLNNYQIGVSDVLGTSYTKVCEPGYQLLNGLQATAYCRIRATKGSDFKRTERQREVLKAIEARAKEKDLPTLLAAFNNAIGDVYTNIDSEDIILLLNNLSDYHIADEGGFPLSTLRTNVNVGAKGSCVVPTSLEENVKWLHEFLFDDDDYQVTDTVREYGAAILAETGPYMKK